MVEGRHARYVRWLFESTPQTIRRWVHDEQLRHELGNFFDQIWMERVENPEWLAGFARECAVDGADPHDYRMREIEVLPDALVLAGIHFRHRDVDQPFVGVFAQSRDLNDVEMETATSALGEAFRLFNPQTVRWWAPEQRDVSTLSGAAGDYRLVVVGFKTWQVPQPLSFQTDSLLSPSDLVPAMATTNAPMLSLRRAPPFGTSPGLNDWQPWKSVTTTVRCIV
jgi:hypothetical protein